MRRLSSQHQRHGAVGGGEDRVGPAVMQCDTMAASDAHGARHNNEESDVTSKDIIDMAQEAGLPLAWISEKGVIQWKQLERFAALVGAAERERCTGSSGSAWAR